jgi:hypothetical protein
MCAIADEAADSGSPRVEEGPQEKNSGERSEEYERIVPFSDFVSQAAPSVVETDYLTAGLAAAFTTHIDNPVFKLPSAQDERDGALPAAFAMYAPYYIGTGLTAEQIARDIAGQAAMYLKSLDVQHGHDGYVGRVLAVLRSGRIAHHGLQAIEDRNILYDVHDFLALITNRLHHIVPLTLVGGRLYSAAQAYREGTHDKVDPYSKTFVYRYTPGGYNERFELPEYIRSDPAKLVALGWDLFDTKSMQRGAEFAALAAEKLGDPVVRCALSEHYVPAHRRSRDYLVASR